MTNTGTDLTAISDLRAALEAAENAGDADAAAALLTEDAVLMVPDFPVQEGRVACASFLHEIMGWLSTRFHRHITYVSGEVVVMGYVAFDRGTFSFLVSPRSGGASSQVTGKYLWLLQRTGSGWKLARLIVARDDSGDAGSTGGMETESATHGV